MEKQEIGRREILRTVGAVAGGAALATAAMSSTAHADDGHDDERRRINGSWMVTAVVDGQPGSTMVVASFATGGVAISHEIQPAGPPYTGTWARTGGNGLQSTMWSGTPGQGPGSPGDTAKLHVEGTLNSDGTISGKFTVTIFPADGGPSQTFTGTFTGERIHADD